jgi:hypothetical protein
MRGGHRPSCHGIVTCSCSDENDLAGHWLRLVAPHSAVVVRCETNLNNCGRSNPEPASHLC